MNSPSTPPQTRPHVIVTGNRPHFVNSFVEHLSGELPDHDVVCLMAGSADEVERALLVAVQKDHNISALVVIGGDGMVHIGANVLAGGAVPLHIPLAIVPAGSGNDFVRSAGTHAPKRERLQMGAMAARIAASIRESRVRHVDAMRVTGDWGSRIVMGIASVGVDAVINRHANSLRFPPGQSKYLAALARKWRSLKPHAYRFEVTDANGSVRSGSTTAWLASVANSQYLGGGMKIVPDAALDDGLLDFCIIRPLSWLEFARLFPLIFSGKHASHGAVTIERVTKVVLETADITAYGDGEELGPTPVRVEVLPGAVSLLY